jgi:hypothetical protein
MYVLLTVLTPPHVCIAESAIEHTEDLHLSCIPARFASRGRQKFTASWHFSLLQLTINAY